jgi:hypothetical protein
LIAIDQTLGFPKIISLMTKTLFSKVIGGSKLLNKAQPLIQKSRMHLKLAQPNAKVIALMHTATELFMVAMGSENVEVAVL